MTRRARCHASDGFTLIEIVAAIAILATGLMVLIESHYNTLRLFDMTQEEATIGILMDTAVNIAELEVLTGKLNGEGDFGKRYAGYGYAFSAAQSEEYDSLYNIDVSVAGPSEERTVVFMAYKNQIQ